MWLNQSHSFQILVYCMMAVFWAKPGGWEKRKTAESCFDPCHILSKRVKLGGLNWTFRELFWSNLPAAEDLLLLMFLLLEEQKIEIHKKITWNSIPNTLLGRHSLMADLMIWIFEGRLFSTLGCFPEKGFCDFQKSFKKMQIFSFASFS